MPTPLKLTPAPALPSRPPVDSMALAWQFVRQAAPLIRNVKTRMLLLEIGPHAFPVSVNDGGECPGSTTANSYVVSPLTAYTGYADYELEHLGRPWLARPLQALAAHVGRQLAAARIDRIVQINNWLLSTNLYPPEAETAEASDNLLASLPALTAQFAEQFPDHTFGFRSLNRFSNPRLLAALTAQGYVSIPSRQVYLFDARQGEHAAFLQRHNVAVDGRLLRRSAYRFRPACTLGREDYTRLEQLYNLLYLDKYCPLNPQFTADWLYRGQQDGWLALEALCTPAGRIDGVVGCFSHAQTITAPIVGYDTTLPQSLGLYRLLTRRCLQLAIEQRSVLNFSSGAAHFKRLRGGQPEIEYSMVYVAHLPKARQRIWHRLGWLLHTLGVPLMQRLKL